MPPLNHGARRPETSPAFIQTVLVAPICCVRLGVGYQVEKSQRAIQDDRSSGIGTCVLAPRQLVARSESATRARAIAGENTRACAPQCHSCGGERRQPVVKSKPV